MNQTFFRISLAATVLALFVVVLGAYVRLADAGLGCPDWPGCYGQIIAPSAAPSIHIANQAFPDTPVETPKAWKEMVHRYFASTLGLLILAMAAIALKHRKKPKPQVKLSIFLVLLVCFQGALGMWTVTMLLKPFIVTLHLLGGMLTLALLFWATLTAYQNSRPDKQVSNSKSHILTSPTVKRWAFLALVVVYIQIALGGWTSTNYVALYCTDLPTCQGQWLPPTDFKEGFTLWHKDHTEGKNYEGGVLSLEAGTAVHITHRIGAMITLLIVGGFAFKLFTLGTAIARRCGLILGIVLGTQISLGLLNIILVLPIPIAVAHNGVAAILLLTLIAITRKITTVVSINEKESTPNLSRLAQTA
jgi:cytochrome c oxidase assembly protein subunit 15